MPLRAMVHYLNKFLQTTPSLPIKVEKQFGVESLVLWHTKWTTLDNLLGSFLDPTLGILKSLRS
jgi:hypothetical protein